MRLFAPKDKDVPMPLKARIGKWYDTPPTSQFQQYGPLNIYLNRKFKRDTQMVKPQAMFRQPLDSDDNDLLLDWGDGIMEDSELPDNDPELALIIQQLRQDREAGDITIDSTNQGYTKSGAKLFPDFAICEYFDSPSDNVPSNMTRADKKKEKKDKVRMLVEVASLPRRGGDAALKRVRGETLEQLRDYMEELGEPGQRYDEGRIMGMALVGIYASFLLPRDGHPGDWAQKGGIWYNMFSAVFQRTIDEVVAYESPEPSEEEEEEEEET